MYSFLVNISRNSPGVPQRYAKCADNAMLTYKIYNRGTDRLEPRYICIYDVVLRMHERFLRIYICQMVGCTHGILDDARLNCL